MKKKKLAIFGICLSIFFLIMGGALGSFVRGVYDRHMMTEGLVHVVNASPSAEEVEIIFPSGTIRAMPLAPGAGATFVAGDTGEGAIGVKLEGRGTEEVGYVTSSNGMVVLCVGSEDVAFTQVFPSDLER